MDNKEKQIAIILNKHFVGKKEIFSQTRIYHDLWLFGDAAEDFLQEFSKEFDVNFDSFEFKNYFLYEGMPPSYMWIGLKRLFGYKEDPSKIPITVSHLTKVAEKQVWFDPA